MKIKLLTCFLFIGSIAYGQVDRYDFFRELQGVTGQWHKLTLPNDVIGKLDKDMTAIRIFGITEKNDTIEAPYIMKQQSEKITSAEVPFNFINQSKNAKGFYFTFEMPQIKPINQIKLEFREKNFDRRLKLEGSNDQKTWFTIVEDYRILSIKNTLTNYQFTTIRFPDSRYRFFRVQLDNSTAPDFAGAKLALYKIAEGHYRDYPVVSTKKEEDKSAKKTVIDVDLGSPVAVSYLQINVNDKVDYYRPVTIKYLSDSLETQQGLKYNYSVLGTGTLNSIEANEFKFNSTIIQKIRIEIQNHDNLPLTIGSVMVKGYTHDLFVRFTEPATYYLAYGKNRTGVPRYDIERFTENIPDSLTTLNLAFEQKIVKKPAKVIEPLFKNKAWLWAIMGLIIVLLGWFSLKMMKKG